MHDMEMVAMWFLLVNAGMVLTMLLPRMVAAPSRKGRLHNERMERPVQDDVDGQRGMIALSGYVPNVYLVSTSWVWGVPHADGAPGAQEDNQAQQSEPSSTQPASLIRWKDRETALHEEERDLVTDHTET